MRRQMVPWPEWIASSLLLAVILGFGRTGLADSSGPIVFLSAPDRVDMAEDPVRDILYISSSDGNLLRYSLTGNAWLSPISVGGSPNGMDISPDGSTLVVADASSNGYTDRIDVVNLATGSSRTIPFPLSAYEGGGYTAAFTDNSHVLVSTSYLGSGWVPLRKIDLSTGAASTIATVRQNTMLSASADHSVVAIAEANEEPVGAERYCTSNGNIASATDNPWSLFEIAASRNGQQYAVPTYNGTYILNQNLKQVGLIGTYATCMPIGVAYSPTKDLVYFAWADFNYQHSRIDVYNTNTLQEVGVIDSGTPFDSTGNWAFQEGRLRVSADGSLLFASVPGGVDVYAVPEPSTLALLGIGAVSLLGYAWRRRRAA